MPRGRIAYMRRLQSLISDPHGVRFEVNYGTPYHTGQTMARVELYLDLANLLQTNYDAIQAKHGVKRAERFAQWANGRRIRSYWQAHRKQLYEDIECLKTDMELHERII